MWNKICNQPQLHHWATSGGADIATSLCSLYFHSSLGISNPFSEIMQAFRGIIQPFRGRIHPFRTIVHNTVCYQRTTQAIPLWLYQLLLIAENWLSSLSKKKRKWRIRTMENASTNLYLVIMELVSFSANTRLGMKDNLSSVYTYCKARYL